MKSAPALGYGHGAHEYRYNGGTYPTAHAGPYRYPEGFGYRRFVAGRTFPRTLWVHDYYVYNYVDYGLPPPAAGAQWIRFGPDLLLVDLGSGLITQVVPGVFAEDGGDPSE